MIIRDEGIPAEKHAGITARDEGIPVEEHPGMTTRDEGTQKKNPGRGTRIFDYK